MLSYRISILNANVMSVLHAHTHFFCAYWNNLQMRSNSGFADCDKSVSPLVGNHKVMFPVRRVSAPR